MNLDELTEKAALLETIKQTLIDITDIFNSDKFPAMSDLEELAKAASDVAANLQAAQACDIG